MNYGEISFDMTVDQHATGSRSDYLLKRWRKFTIYAKSGSYNRTDNPLENLYSTSSVYLYDYVVVRKDWYSSMVYTSSFIDTTPADYTSETGSNQWFHRENTFRNSPNAIVNNYQLQYNPIASGIFPARPRYGYSPLFPSFNPPPIYTDQGEYFEIVGSYPLNHFTHKRSLFSLFNMTTYGMEAGVVTSGSYFRCQQTITTTIGENGLEDGSAPVQSTQVGNLNLIQSDNVINK